MSNQRTIEAYIGARAPHLAPRRSGLNRPADGTPRTVVVLVSLMVLAALAVLGTIVPSYADPVPAVRVHVVKVDPAPAGPAITVTLSNGVADVLRPCVYEDGRRCYWLADQMGNGRGQSFVVTRGRIFRLDLTGFNPLA